LLLNAQLNYASAKLGIVLPLLCCEMLRLCLTALCLAVIRNAAAIAPRCGAALSRCFAVNRFAFAMPLLCRAWLDNAFA
jgi:hypothetical protein